MWAYPSGWLFETSVCQAALYISEHTVGELCMCDGLCRHFSSNDSSKKYSCSPVFFFSYLHLHCLYQLSLNYKNMIYASGKQNPLGVSLCTNSQSQFNNITARKSFGPCCAATRQRSIVLESPRIINDVNNKTEYIDRCTVCFHLLQPLCQVQGAAKQLHPNSEVWGNYPRCWTRQKESINEN